MAKHAAVHALALGAFLAVSLTSAAQAQRSEYTQQVSLPEGTVLRAELKDPLSSVDNRPGDRFTATIRSDEDGSRLPAGTEVVGQVRTVRRASERQPGTLDVDLTSLRTPDGRTYPITGSLTSLDAKSVRRTSDGRLEATGSSSRDRTKFIGYGAGAGALIGALTGNDLLLSTILGAGAGYLYNELSKDKKRSGSYSDVSLKAGTEFGVRLDRQLAMAVPADRTRRYDDRYPRNSGRTDPYSNRYDRYDRAGTTNGYAPSDIRVLVNERAVRFNEDRPFMANGRVMVPLAPVMDATGYRYDYDTRNREITVRGDRGDTRLTLGDTFALVDGQRVRLDAPAQRIDGVLFVPTQFLEEATDIRTDWDASSRTLRLTSRYRATRTYDDSDTRVVR